MNVGIRSFFKIRLWFCRELLYTPNETEIHGFGELHWQCRHPTSMPLPSSRRKCVTHFDGQHDHITQEIGMAWSLMCKPVISAWTACSWFASFAQSTRKAGLRNPTLPLERPSKS